MSDAFDELARHLGKVKLHSYAVDHDISKDDPGWVGAMQMIPILDAMDARIETVRAIAADIPETLRAAMAESVHGLRAEIVAASAEAIREQTMPGIVKIIAATAADLQAVVDEAVTTLKTSQAKFGSAADGAVGKAKTAAEEITLAAMGHTRLLASHTLGAWIKYAIVAFAMAIGTWSITHFVFDGHLYNAGWNAGAAAVRAHGGR
jgi:hypothetical protein